MRNIKYRLTKKSNPTPFNAGDQIVHVEELVKTHPLVYSVKDLNEVDHPLPKLYSEQQITDVKRFCGTGRTVLGVDQMYNLAYFHVTPTVSKDPSVKRKDTDYFRTNFHSHKL